MTTLTSSQIKEHLHQNVCTVVFEKADGTTRKMNCTLNQNVIEMHNLTPVGSGPVYDENQIRVVDVDIMQWRSFKYDKIISFSPELVK